MDFMESLKRLENYAVFMFINIFTNDPHRCLNSN